MKLFILSNWLEHMKATPNILCAASIPSKVKEENPDWEPLCA